MRRYKFLKKNNEYFRIFIDSLRIKNKKRKNYLQKMHSSSNNTENIINDERKYVLSEYEQESVNFLKSEWINNYKVPFIEEFHGYPYNELFNGSRNSSEIEEILKENNILFLNLRQVDSAECNENLMIAVKRCAEKGFTVEETAEKLKLSLGTILRAEKNFNIKFKKCNCIKTKKYYKIGNLKDKIIKLIHKRKTSEEIIKELNLKLSRKYFYILCENLNISIKQIREDLSLRNPSRKKFIDPEIGMLVKYNIYEFRNDISYTIGKIVKIYNFGVFIKRIAEFDDGRMKDVRNEKLWNNENNINRINWSDNFISGRIEII